jgi:hypothetical protein
MISSQMAVPDTRLPIAAHKPNVCFLDISFPKDSNHPFKDCCVPTTGIHRYSRPISSLTAAERPEQTLFFS